MSTKPRSGKIGIIGAGVSGLSLGFWLKKLGRNFEILEGRDRVGGYAGSYIQDGWVVETGPNSLLTNEPRFNQLLQELDLEGRRIFPSPLAKARFVYKGRTLHRFPMSPPALLKTKLLSGGAKIKILTEWLRPIPKAAENESIFAFFARHFGEEMCEALLRPALVGVFAGDIRDLHMESCLPKLQKLEELSPSLIRGMLKSKKSGPRAQLFTLPGGTQELVHALAERIQPDLSLSTMVGGLERADGGWRLDTSKGPRHYDQIVLSCPWQAIEKWFPSLLKTEPNDFAPVVSLSLGVRGSSPIQGFGLLVHPDEGLKVLGVLAPSEIFPNRAPKGHSLLTLIMGGSFHPELASKSEAEILSQAERDLATIFGRAPQWDRHWLHRWPMGITQYTVQNHTRLSAQAQALESLGGLYVNSHAFGGVSVSDCVRRSWELAQRL